MPTRDELAVLLRRYLDGPVDDEAVARLDLQFRELLADSSRRGPEESAFRANGRRYLGQAWKELLSPHEHLPSPVELALWLAVVTPGYSPPRWLRPAELVGRWQQHEPNAAHWELASDGRFSSTEKRLARLVESRWCVHLRSRRGDLVRDQLWLIDDQPHTNSRKPFIIIECTDDRLRLVQPGGDFGDVEYKLTRSG